MLEEWSSDPIVPESLKEGVGRETTQSLAKGEGSPELKQQRKWKGASYERERNSNLINFVPAWTWKAKGGRAIV